MNFKWDKIRLPQELLEYDSFKNAVNQTLSIEWSPPDGYMHLSYWEDNYQTWHAHLIPKEHFFIPMEEAIEKYGLPYYSPAENPNTQTSDINKQNTLKDIQERLELIKSAKDKYDVRWYMMAHACQFNAITVFIIVKYLFPTVNWKIIDADYHVFVTNGTIGNVEEFVTNRQNTSNSGLIIADPVITNYNIFKNLVIGSIGKWVVYDTLDAYNIELRKKFFSD